MAKVSGSYSSVVLGVSEQVPQDRRSGQHYEQVNMISDPVRGLARRHGSKLMHEKFLTNATQGVVDSYLSTTQHHKAHSFFVDGLEYDFIVGTRSGDTTVRRSWCYNKDTNQYIDVNVHGAVPDKPIASFVNVGRYVFMSQKDEVSSVTGVDTWGNSANLSKLVAWVRGGQYSRTYTITVTKTDNTKVTVSYKTMASSYPILLDTSDIPTSDPDYYNKINKRVAEYNSAVTKYIGDAAEDITPQNIASKLAAALTTAGITGVTVVGGTVCISNTGLKEISCEDGGDGTNLRGVGAEVSNIDLVSSIHWAGKVVKVRPKKNDGTDALYLQAVAKDGVSTGFVEVTWKEVAGFENTPSNVFLLATVKGATMHIAASPEALATMIGEAVPAFKSNTVGDELTAPLPYFIGKQVDYLGLFQDRLIIGSGATLFFSRPGDYFNWFRASVLSVVETDPVEMYALGSEDDVIRSSTTYDRNLTLFGERHQYVVNGRQKLTPDATIQLLSSYEDALDADPTSSGNFVFYTKTRNGITSLHQIQMGQLVDSPESYNVSQQLDRYIKGVPTEIVTLTSPNKVFVRTTDARNVLYTYAYLDSATGTERLFDSWSRWEWDFTLGEVIGVSRDKGDLLVYVLRWSDQGSTNKTLFVAAERFVVDTGLSPYPYLDSLRTTASQIDLMLHQTVLHETNVRMADKVWLAYGDDSPYYLLGLPYEDRETMFTQYPDARANTWIGVEYEGKATPTNPFIRDRNDRAIVTGRLTLSMVDISVADTGGLYVDRTTSTGTVQVKSFNGRLLGRGSNLVGRAPVVTTSVTAAIGKEIRECNYTIRTRTFLPLTITAISWQGQYFNNERRVT